MQNKQRLDDLVYFTVDRTKKKTHIGLMRFGEWIEIYHGEAIMAHSSHTEYLTRMGLKRCKGPTIYRSQKQAVKGKRSNIRMRVSE